MSTEFIEALDAVSLELSALNEAVRSSNQMDKEIKTGLELVGETLRCMNANIADMKTSIGCLRRDIESIRKFGCERQCPPDPDSDTITSPAIPLLAAGTNG